jgi:hypothetical protein
VTDPNLIPTLDPNPLPAPYWIFKLLLIVTFVLHILAMNSLLGGAVLALAAKWRSKNRELGNRIFVDMSKKLPVLLPATITLGIAPLLFLQVLYGQFFYASSIVVAWPWFLVLVLLTTAYYGFYYSSFKSGQDPGKAATVSSVSLILIFLIGFIYSNNLTLSQSPLRWKTKYFANPNGWNLNLAEPTLIPRFLHFMVAAVAVGGLLLVFLAFARWNQDREYARSIFRLGGKAFMFATMAQFVVGIWFLVSLPRNLRMMLLGQNVIALILLAMGVLGGIAAIFLMSEALRAENVSFAAKYVSTVVAVVIAAMAVVRDMLRDAYLAPYYRPGQFAVKTQWSVFPLFLALFVGGVILWFVMLGRYGLFRGTTTAHDVEHATPALTGAGR